MKKHKVTPLESIEIEFLDKKLMWTFDMYAITKLQNTFGELEKLAKSVTEMELAAILFWSGIKDSEMTLDEAKVIITSSAQVLADVLTITFESIKQLGGEHLEKKLIEEIERVQKVII